MKTQKFNVLCVTKTYRLKCYDPWQIKKHQPITGQALLEIVICRNFNVPLAKTIVLFNEKKYTLVEVKTGLKDCSITLAVDVDDPPFDRWELHTDQPTSESSREELLIIAREEIEKNKN